MRSIIHGASWGDAAGRAPLSPTRLLPVARELALRPRLTDLLDPGSAQRQLVPLQTGPDWEAWLVSWPGDTDSGWHDHGCSSGAILVVEGRLLEQSWEHGQCVDSVRRRGQGFTFVAQRTHNVVNIGPGAAMSIHLYAPRLTSLTRYDLTADGPLPGRTERAGLDW